MFGSQEFYVHLDVAQQTRKTTISLKRYTLYRTIILSFIKCNWRSEYMDHYSFILDIALQTRKTTKTSGEGPQRL